jgi:hypothetical protein
MGQLTPASKQCLVNGINCHENKWPTYPMGRYPDSKYQNEIVNKLYFRNQNTQILAKIISFLFAKNINIS